MALIGRLSCDLVEVTGRIRLAPGSRLADLCGAFELDGHTFFFGTASQPERSALADRDHPLIIAFVRACAEARVRRAVAAG